MALYINGEAKKLHLNGGQYHLNAFGQIIETIDGKLLDANKRILRDANGMYLLVKEEDNNGK